MTRGREEEGGGAARGRGLLTVNSIIIIYQSINQNMHAITSMPINGH